MQGLDYWRLCDELNVIQAALLLVGENPAGAQEYLENWDPHQRPDGYEAAYAALTHAILAKRLPATLRLTSIDSEWEDGKTPDWRKTTFSVEDLKKWLMSRGFREGFFFPEGTGGPDYLDPNHSNYAPKLAAAIGAWTALNADPESARGKSVKQALSIWLRRNASTFGLTKEDGNPNEQGIEEIAKIANWDTRGGAPKTPGN